MLSFSYVHISVHLVSTELVFPDKCFAIFFVSFEFILPCFYGFCFYFTGIFNISFNDSMQFLFPYVCKLKFSFSGSHTLFQYLHFL